MGLTEGVRCTQGMKAEEIDVEIAVRLAMFSRECRRRPTQSGDHNQGNGNGLRLRASVWSDLAKKDKTGPFRFTRDKIK